MSNQREKDGKFAKGNTLSVGNEGGRPMMYPNPEQLEEKIKEYFIFCQGEYEEREGERTISKGKGQNATETRETYTYMFCIREPETPSITGLALFLGFSSKDSLYDYEKKPEYSDFVKRGMLFIEKRYESGLWNDRPTGAIFALKNMGWKDKHEHDHTTNGENINIINLGVGINPDESTD